MTESNINNEYPWIEKYRPKSIKDIISQDESINILKNTLETGDMPHLLLYGGSGTGKTSTILSLCRELFGSDKISERVLELNASDERGINIVRTKIINFAKIAIGTRDSRYLCPPYKIIILDEADAMTKEAQSALRKVMEETSMITRFCFICNYVNQIIDPINSRCVKLRFRSIRQDDINIKLKNIRDQEKMWIDDECIELISEISNGDLRRGILLLQNTKYIKKEKIEREDIYDMCKYITSYEMNRYMERLESDKSIKSIINITREIINNGYIYNSIIMEISKYIIRKNMEDDKKGKLLFMVAEIEKKLNDRCDEYIQLLTLFTEICYNKI
jgi:replication factor C subunit 2/4